MKLYLVRHGNYSVDNLAHDDLLTAPGMQEVNALADFLKQKNIVVQEMFHSGKTRARQTAEILANLICAKSPEEKKGLHPNDDVNAFLHEIATWQIDTCIVGHLPFLPRLLSLLILNQEDKELVVFQTSTMVCLERVGNDRWMIEWVMTPGLLKSS